MDGWFQVSVFEDNDGRVQRERKIMMDFLRFLGLKEDLKTLDVYNFKTLKCDTTLGPPFPNMYVDVANRWQMEGKGFIGHGQFFKASDSAEMNKDNCYKDFDSLDVFYPLKKARMIWIDEDLAKNHLEFSSLEEVVKLTAYISRGQVERLKKGESRLFDFETVEDIVELEHPKVGLRQRGGGRAATLFDSFTFNKETYYEAKNMVDVKGVGTSELQKKFPPSATGFLCLADALKEVCYERLIQRKVYPKTVKHLAIVDCGFSYVGENPATGYVGDRVVLMIRQPHSRLCSEPDEPVYYAVAQPEHLRSETGKEIRESLLRCGMSSEQIYKVPELEGGWNIQTEASFSHLVDFSHFYCSPESPFKSFRMSEEAFSKAHQVMGKWSWSLGPEFRERGGWKEEWDKTEQPSRWLALRNCFDAQEEEGDDWQSELMEDIKSECESYGPVKDCKVESSFNAIYVSYEDVEAAQKAHASLSGRFFGGRTVSVDFVCPGVSLDEQLRMKREKGDFEALQKMGKVGNRKPSHSWSWLLEVDDSEVCRWIESVSKETDLKVEDVKAKIESFLV